MFKMPAYEAARQRTRRGSRWCRRCRRWRLEVGQHQLIDLRISGVGINVRSRRRHLVGRHRDRARTPATPWHRALRPRR